MYILMIEASVVACVTFQQKTHFSLSMLIDASGMDIPISSEVSN